ncbi:hypothetical protein TrST_g5455 [Triparma strigata]|uniref:Uncharacterized protein n=2 Tax=Triparma strigata TaxID=1606541 RepID=A0A9W7C2E4_9STRA|nr:hypothetical protein TrST_g5455 [Triparma strigata]
MMNPPSSKRREAFIPPPSPAVKRFALRRLEREHKKVIIDPVRLPLEPLAGFAAPQAPVSLIDLAESKKFMLLRLTMSKKTTTKSSLLQQSREGLGLAEVLVRSSPADLPSLLSVASKLDVLPSVTTPSLLQTSVTHGTLETCELLLPHYNPIALFALTSPNPSTSSWLDSQKSFYAGYKNLVSMRTTVLWVTLRLPTHRVTGPGLTHPTVVYLKRLSKVSPSLIRKIVMYVGCTSPPSTHSLLNALESSRLSLKVQSLQLLLSNSSNFAPSPIFGEISGNSDDFIVDVVETPKRKRELFKKKIFRGFGTEE